MVFISTKEEVLLAEKLAFDVEKILVFMIDYGKKEFLTQVTSIYGRFFFFQSASG